MEGESEKVGGEREAKGREGRRSKREKNTSLIPRLFPAARDVDA